MGNKYHARRTWSELCQRTFDSKAECLHGEDLCLLEKAGEIFDLRYQWKFYLSEKPKVTITIDFCYLRPVKVGDVILRERVFEDVKGVLTRDFRTKLAWLKQKERIEVNLIR